MSDIGLKARYFAGLLTLPTPTSPFSFTDVVECVDIDHARAVVALQGQGWTIVRAFVSVTTSSDGLSCPSVIALRASIGPTGEWTPLEALSNYRDLSVKLGIERYLCGQG